jgi:hypothetical protein
MPSVNAGFARHQAALGVVFRDDVIRHGNLL